MGAGRPGTRFRDPALPPPVDAELTRLSLRWTYRALYFVLAVWATAGAVGAYYDVTTRYEYLTLTVVIGGRGGGAAWDFQISRGDLAVFASALMTLALIPALIGARQMSVIARTGRPHHGPNRWSITGVVLAAGLGPDVVGSFILSDLYSPISDAVYVAGFASLLLCLFAWAGVTAHVSLRFNPWLWQAHLDRRARRAPTRRRADARAPGDASVTATTRSWVTELLVGERPPSAAPRARVRRAVRADRRLVDVTQAGVSWRTRAGRSGFIPAARIAQVRGVEVEMWGTRPLVLAYALVLDHDGAVLLRVSATRAGSQATAVGMAHLREMWAPLGVPVARETSVLGRAKDFRRRWPEAFSWVGAYPFASVLVAGSLWMAVVVPLLDALASH